MSKKQNKISYTRFVYSIIDFFGSESKIPFDVSSYIKNQDSEECQFARSKISRFIQRNRKRESNNRLFLTITLNSNTGIVAEGRKILQFMTEELLDKFLNSSCIETLYKIDSSAFIEVFSSREMSSMTDYIIIIFNVSKCSSIECIISTNDITSKLIEKDEDGDVLEFHSTLYRNIQMFKQNLK